MATQADAQDLQVLQRPEFGSLVGSSVRRTGDEEAKVQLFDRIDGTWTSFLSEERANAWYIRKMTYVCSVCKWTSAWERDFKSHVTSAAATYRTHKDAEVTPVVTGVGPGYRCSGCSSTFSFAGRAQRHIDAIHSQGGGHEGAELLLVRRFSLEPSVPLVAVQAASGPVTSQVERSVAPRRRRRRRNRNRGTHGNRS